MHKHKHAFENKLFITFLLGNKKEDEFLFCTEGKNDVTCVSVWAQMTLTHKV